MYIAIGTVYFMGTTKFFGNGNVGHSGIFISLSNLFFAGNTTFKNFSSNRNGAAVLAVFSRLYFSGETRFEDNEATTGGAISLTSSTVYGTGNMTFLRNHAKYGGAMLMVKSEIHLKPPVQMNFSYNTASVYGGGIYVAASDLDEDPVYFIQFTVGHNATALTTGDIQMYFIYNKAGIAGSAPYGETFDTCITIFKSPLSPLFFGTELIDKVFHFQTNESDLSVVSSEPNRVCICEDNQPQCEILEYNTTVYPGEIFTLSLIGIFV